jgi:putative hydrolase of the HAD superfamily
MPERPSLAAVVFDAGGTLVRVDFEWIAEVLGTLGVATDAERVRRAEVSGRRSYDASKGRRGGATPPLGTIGDIHAYYGGMLRAAGAPDDVVATCIERFTDRHSTRAGLWSRPMEGARAALDGIAARRLRRAVVSNSDGRAEQHLRDSDMLRGIEFVVDSEIVGIEKPDPGIFRLALDRLGIAPDQALYVGDIRSVDEVGSRAAGMHFVLVDEYGEYAEAGTPAIRGMAELPEWIDANFTYHLKPSAAR